MAGSTPTTKMNGEKTIIPGITRPKYLGPCEIAAAKQKPIHPNAGPANRNM